MLLVFLKYRFNMTRTCLLQSLLLGLPRSPGRSPQLRRLLLNTENATVRNYQQKSQTTPKNSKRKPTLSNKAQQRKKRRNRAGWRSLDGGKRDNLNISRQQMNISRIGGESCRRQPPGKSLRTTRSRTEDYRIFRIYSIAGSKKSGFERANLALFWD